MRVAITSVAARLVSTYRTLSDNEEQEIRTRAIHLSMTALGLFEKTPTLRLYRSHYGRPCNV